MQPILNAHNRLAKPIMEIGMVPQICHHASYSHAAGEGGHYRERLEIKRLGHMNTWLSSLFLFACPPVRDDNPRPFYIQE